MKRLIVFILAVVAISPAAVSQTYYHMWRGLGDSGRPEWIANTATGYPFTGIQFTTAHCFRGCVNGSGRWLFWDPQDAVRTSAHVGAINERLNSIGTAAAGTHASMVAKRWLLGDISTSDYISSYYGYGRNGDVILSCQMPKWLRLNSYSGIAMWGNGGGVWNESPSLFIGNTYIKSELPFRIHEASMIHIRNDIYTSLSLNSSESAAWFGTTSRHGMEVGTNEKSAIYIGEDQNLYLGFEQVKADSIGTDLKTKYNVFVKKGILSVDYAIAPNETWSDHVFKENYKLKALGEVEDFIKRNGHLPDVPTAEEIREKGYSQHEINKILLQKIEELTLYAIQLQKRIDILETNKK